MDNRRLFIDDRHIRAMTDLARTFHQAEKHEKNPLIVPDLPWERSVGHNHGTVMMDDGKFRLWYTVNAFIDEAAGTNHCAYADSSDGISWSKPDLGLVTINGASENNLVMHDAMHSNLVKDDHAPDAAQRYKLLYYGTGRDKPGALSKSMGGAGSWGWCVAFSPDGFNWTRHSDNPVYTAAADEGSFFGWDETAGRYVAFLRPCIWKPGDDEGELHGWHNGAPAPVDEKMQQFPHQRLIGRMTSEDCVNWGPISTVIAMDDLDAPVTEFYSMSAFRYEGWMIGLLYVLYCDPEDRMIRKKGLMDTQLVASRDGIEWLRLGDREPFIPRGARGAFDMGMVGPNSGMAERDGRLWFYYNGWSGEHFETKAYRRRDNPGLHAMGRLCSGIGLATLRQDGFISVDAGDAEGVLVTPPEELSGQKLVINAVTQGTGEIRVEVLDGRDGVVNGYAADCCAPFQGDSVSHEVQWKENSLAALPGGEHSLRFRIRHASLYSYALPRV